MRPQGVHSRGKGSDRLVEVTRCHPENNIKSSTIVHCCRVFVLQVQYGAPNDSMHACALTASCVIKNRGGHSKYFRTKASQQYLAGHCRNHNRLP